MDARKFGSAIRTLRVREGYTQQELAEYLSVTDKAVSKWERGLSIPDIATITLLAGILNTDVDNLLEGNIAYLEDKWHGILKIEPMGQGIHCDSAVYGKPLVEIWISYFMLVGIRQILLEGSAEELDRARELLGDGNRFGIQLTYIDAEHEAELHGQNVMVVYGNIFLYGSNLTRYFQRAMSRVNGITLLAAESDDDKSDSAIFCNQDKRISLRHDKERYACRALQVLFVPKQFEAALQEDMSSVAELRSHFAVYAEVAGRGLAVCSVKNWDDINDVSTFIRIMEKMSGSRVYDINEIARVRGLISGSDING